MRSADGCLTVNPVWIYNELEKITARDRDAIERVARDIDRIAFDVGVMPFGGATLGLLVGLLAARS